MVFKALKLLALHCLRSFSQKLYTVNNRRVPRKKAKSAKETPYNNKQSYKKANQLNLLWHPICAAAKEENLAFLLFFQIASTLLMIRCSIKVVKCMFKVVK